MERQPLQNIHQNLIESNHRVQFRIYDDFSLNTNKCKTNKLSGQTLLKGFGTINKIMRDRFNKALMLKNGFMKLILNMLLTKSIRPSTTPKKRKIQLSDGSHVENDLFICKDSITLSRDSILGTPPRFHCDNRGIEQQSYSSPCRPKLKPDESSGSRLGRCSSTKHHASFDSTPSTNSIDTISDRMRLIEESLHNLTLSINSQNKQQAEETKDEKRGPEIKSQSQEDYNVPNGKRRTFLLQSDDNHRNDGAKDIDSATLHDMIRIAKTDAVRTLLRNDPENANTFESPTSVYSYFDVPPALSPLGDSMICLTTLSSVKNRMNTWRGKYSSKIRNDLSDDKGNSTVNCKRENVI